jgi:tRNA nucleotidyltransferase/poly(A) polymerase
MDKDFQQQILNIVSEYCTSSRPVYLVGGAVRDLLLDRSVHDLDFVMEGETLPLARQIANRMMGGLYVLDEERSTTRVILEVDGTPGSRLVLDFASLRAGDLEGDLRARDFTINALALDVTCPDRLIDPTGGLADLREKRIRACLPTSLEHDPVRVLRAVRQAVGFHFRIDPDTLNQMRKAAPRLPQVSAERLRDELFRMLDGPQVSLAVRILEQCGALAYVLPELSGLRGATQAAPHIHDVWGHTLGVVQALEQLLGPLVGTYQEETVSDLTVGSAVLWLGRYRQQFAEHFVQPLVPDRSTRALLFFAALYHDVAKPATRTVDEHGKVRFIGHPEQGASVAAQRGRALAFSAAEIDRLETIVAEHMRVHFLSKGMPELSRRNVYRYFKATGQAGVDICLLSLADVRGTYGVTLPQEVWEAELRVCRVLLEAYWEKHTEVVSPPRFLTGYDLMEVFQMRPGKQLGRLLEAIREAQAEGEISDRDQALSFAKTWLARDTSPEAL